MIYGIFTGEYSAYHIIGYYNDKAEADKYIATHTDCCMEVINDLSSTVDLSGVNPKYEHEVVFDSKHNEWILRNESDKYKPYICNYLRSNQIVYNGYNWISFKINIKEDNRKLAEKIAQDYLYKILGTSESRDIDISIIKIMNDEFERPEKERKAQEAAEKLKEKELAELKRLKEKYE